MTDDFRNSSRYVNQKPGHPNGGHAGEPLNGVFLEDPDFTLYNGDVRTILAELEPESVHCVVTSPPYWGLRDYGTGTWTGGDPDCDHTPPPGKSGGQRADRTFTLGEIYRETCSKCGARRVDNQLGLEATPDEYITNMVAVFREVRRVLRSDGTCWVNMGDSYHGGGGGNYGTGLSSKQGGQHLTNVRNRLELPGIKPKDLCMIPARLALALQADGWWLRSQIVWSKPNPMPESVTDRPTTSHEYVYLLSKSPRYFFDQEAVREGATWDRWSSKQTTPKHTANGNNRYASFGREWTEEELERYRDGGRNIRSVWEIPTQPYPEAHFATYPEELVRRCILAGCHEGGTVLDPFMGSGTTALVARKHSRRSVGVELNPAYCELAARRLSQLSLLAEGAA